jgi:hypothetical protein
LTQKNWVFQRPPILNIFSPKFQGLILGWVRSIKCEGHQFFSPYMVVRLSGIRSIYCKNTKNAFGWFWSCVGKIANEFRVSFDLFLSRFRRCDESPIRSFRKSKSTINQQCVFKGPHFDQRIRKDVAFWQWESSQTCFINKLTLRWILNFGFWIISLFLVFSRE